MRRWLLWPAVATAVILASGCGGGEKQATRQVAVTMRDTEFTPDRLEVAAGETVGFVFTNAGQAEHEAVIGDQKLQLSQEAGGSDSHAAGHQGSDKVARVVLSPGRTGKLTYTFDEPGEVLIGCHVPGHWTAGMKAIVTVT
ncbi:MAG: cupredoxin domain-containing protein [Acidimicrobiia bacterium]